MQHTEVGIFDAKMHLSALVERANHGETIIITKHGQPKARIVPYVEEAKPQLTLQQIKDGFAAIRAKQKPLPKGMTVTDLVRQWRDEQANKWG